MSIVESLDLEDGVSGPAASAASALESVSDAASSAESALDSISAGGLESAADASSDAASSLDDAADSAEDAASAIDEVADAAEDAGEGGSSAFDALGESAAGFASGVGAAVQVAEKIAKVGKVVLEVGAAFASAVADAHVWREATTAALDQLTGGRGQEALAGLSAAAKDLGISTESAVEQFTDLRSAGASNADASALIKLRADLEAVGVSADTAGAATKTALDRIKAGESAASVIKDIANGYGAVGDGANAAAKRSLTLAGAMQNIQSIGGRVFGRIAEAAGPALDKVGAKITAVLDSIENSDSAAGAIDAIVSVIEALPAVIDGVVAAWHAFTAAAGPGVELASEALGELSVALGGTEGSMSALSAVGSVLGYIVVGIASSIAVAAQIATGFIGALSAIGDAASSMIDAVAAVPETLSALVGSFSSAGSDLVSGFIDGITSMIGGAISAALSLGDAAAGALKSALGIASPSKVAEEAAANFGGTFSSVTEETMPPAIETPEIEAPEVPPVQGGEAAGAPVGGAGGIGSVTIQIIGSTNMSRIELEAATRAGLLQAMREAA